jgi:hypothetical protein
MINETFQIIKNQQIIEIIERTVTLPSSVGTFGSAKITDVTKSGTSILKNNNTVSRRGLNQCRRAMITIYSFGSNLNAIAKDIESDKK